MFSKKLQFLRKNKNETMQELSNVLNVSLATIHMWENGKRTPNIKKLQQVATHYCVTLDYLISNNDDYLEVKIPKNQNCTLIGKNGNFQVYNMEDAEIKALKIFADTLTKTDNKKK